MSECKKSRGRPKGTGIDDTETLDAIADLIAVDEGLRPTTAIKQLGFTDPSVVRRLRDKFKARQRQAASASTQQQMTTTEPVTSPSTSRPDAHRPTATHEQPMSAMACSGVRPFELSEDAEPAVVGSFYNPAAVAICAANISAVQTALTTGHALTQSALQNPFVSLAVTQQLMLQDMALSFFTARIDRRTLH